MSSIVVGVDGSEGSVKALRFALEEGRVRGSDVKAVNAWRIPPIVYEAGWAATPVDLGEYPKFAQKALDKSLEDAGAAGSTVTVTTHVQEGQAADVLCAEAESADLLVVGSHGYGGFRGLLLGSVSQQCAHHAPCPVVIVPRDPSSDALTDA